MSDKLIAEHALPCIDCNAPPKLDTVTHRSHFAGESYEATLWCCRTGFTTKTRDRRSTRGSVTAVTKLWNVKMVRLLKERVLEAVEAHVDAKLPETDNALVQAHRKLVSYKRGEVLYGIGKHKGPDRPAKGKEETRSQARPEPQPE